MRQSPQQRAVSGPALAAGCNLLVCASAIELYILHGCCLLCVIAVCARFVYCKLRFVWLVV